MVYYLKTAFAWICGLERTDNLDGQSIRSDNPEQITPIHDEQISSWHGLCSYAAILILSLCAFVWAFFTDYRIRLN